MKTETETNHDNHHILNRYCEAARVVTMTTCFLYEMNANY